MKLVTRILFIVINFLALACNKVSTYEDVELSSADEKSCGFVQNSGGARVSWKNQIPIVFYFDQSVPENYRSAIVRATEDWNTNSGKILFSISRTIVSSPQWNIDGKNIIYWINRDGIFANPMQQAKSLLRWTGNTLSDVDILVNGHDWNFYMEPGETNAKSSLHLESLLVHELGHALGLIHQPSQKSVMYMALGLYIIRDIPTQEPDLEDVGCEYL
jgi:hypothetical protein